MNNLSSFFYVFIDAAALLTAILGLWFITVVPGIDRFSRNFFKGYFSTMMLCCIFSMIEESLYYSPVSVTAIYIIWIFESLFLSLPCPMLTVYMLHCCGESLKQNKLLRAVMVLWTVFFILLIGGLFIGGYAYLTPDRQYYRESTYPIFVLPLTIIMSFNLEGVIVRRKKLTHKVFRALLIAMIPLTASLFIQLFTDVFAFLDISIVISALVMYSFVLSDQIEQNLQYQQEIADQRASIMVLQMRPHFIYNAMTSIYCLCNQDPHQARQAIMDFTTYLRRNFTAIVSKEPIPFSAELEHTKAYLAVEQAQYEEALFVDYDTPHTYFRLPPLTLQPIVENAVKHGRDPYAGPFHISIRTRKMEDGSEIVVADDGRGYAAGDETEPHIALKNIQERLELMCGGTITITPGDSGGTVVIITIPDKSTK